MEPFEFSQVDHIVSARCGVTAVRFGTGLCEITQPYPLVRDLILNAATTSDTAPSELVVDVAGARLDVSGRVSDVTDIAERLAAAAITVDDIARVLGGGPGASFEVASRLRECRAARLTGINAEVERDRIRAAILLTEQRSCDARLREVRSNMAQLETELEHLSMDLDAWGRTSAELELDAIMTGNRTGDLSGLRRAENLHAQLRRRWKIYEGVATRLSIGQAQKRDLEDALAEVLDAGRRAEASVAQRFTPELAQELGVYTAYFAALFSGSGEVTISSTGHVYSNMHPPIAALILELAACAAAGMASVFVDRKLLWNQRVPETGFGDIFDQVVVTN